MTGRLLVIGIAVFFGLVCWELRNDPWPWQNQPINGMAVFIPANTDQDVVIHDLRTALFAKGSNE